MDFYPFLEMKGQAFLLSVNHFKNDFLGGL